MNFTGERVVPGQVDADLWQEHVSRYEFARSWITPGAEIRDVGCGAGYGAAILADSAAARVLALDIDTEAIEWARAHYQAPKLRFKQADCTEMLDFDGTFDLIVAFEVIEHLARPEMFLKEARRVMRRDGTLLVSTPNRRYYTEERGVKNPFHTREYDAAEFRALLGGFFAHVQLLGQNHVPAITFSRPGAEMSLRAAAAPGNDEPYFFLAVCSHEPQTVKGLVYLPETGNVLRERELHIHKLESDIASLQRETNRELEERRAWAAKLDLELHEKGEVIARLEQEMEERREWVQNLEARIAEREAQIIERQQAVEKVEAELRERAEWAASLEARIAERDALVIERQQAVEKLETESRQAAGQFEAELREKNAWAESLNGEIEAARTRLQELGAELEERNAWAQNLNAEIASLGARLAAAQAQLEAAHAQLSVLLGSRWYRAGKLLGLAPTPKVDREVDRRKQP